MNLKPYIAKQEQLETYRANLDTLEYQIASAGGDLRAPVSLINHRNTTQKHIDKLEQEIHQIELKIIEESPTIQAAFKDQDKRIDQLLSEVITLRQTSIEKDKRIAELSWIPVNIKPLTPQERKQAYDEAESFTLLAANYGDELLKDYAVNRRNLSKILKNITDSYANLLMNMRKYYE